MTAPHTPSSHAAAAERLHGIQVLRALAALLVLASHTAWYEAQATDATLLPQWLFVGGAGVDLFFVISGFVIVYVTRGLFGARRNTLLFLYNRAGRIYPPVWLFTALALPGFFLIGNTDWLTAEGIAATLLLFPSSEPLVLGVAWTLVHEMYFYLVFALFLLGPARLLPLWLALWAGLIVVADIMGWRQAGPWAHLMLHPMTLEFIMGCVAGLLVCSGRRRGGAWILGAGLILFAASWAYLAALGEAAFPHYWGRTILLGGPAALIVYGMATLETDSGWRPPRAAVRIGDWSYSLYLSHWLVLSALSRLWAPWTLDGTWIDNAVWTALGVCACLTVAALAYHFYERPALRLVGQGRRRLFGAATPPRAALASRIW